MAVNLFSNGNKPSMHVGRNGFDESSAHTFVMRCGVTRPVVVQETVPNSSFKINCGDIVRTSGLQTAAFVRGRHELDFYFIPYRQLASKFDEIVFGRGDVHHPNLSGISNTTLAYLPAYVFYETACDIFIYSHILLEYKKLCELSEPFNSEYHGDAFRWIDKYNTIFFNTDPSSLLRDHATAQKFLLDHICYDTFSAYIDPHFYRSAHFVGAGAIQLLSSLGYGDIYQRVQNILDSVYNGYLEVPASQTAGVFETYLTNLAKAINKLYNQFNEIPTGFNLLRVSAYQKVWYDIYRDSVNDNNNSYAYSITADLDSVRFQKMNTSLHVFFTDPLADFTSVPSDSFGYVYLKPRLRQYKKDLNTGLWPSTQFGDYAVADDVTDESLSLARPADATHDGDVTAAYAMKFAFALQKYRESLMRAGSRTRDLLEAEFGVKSQYINDTYVHSLGSFGGSLDINKVAATSESGSYSVGDLAANIFTSLSGDTIDFTCNDFGIIIGVMSFLPEMFHNATGISPFVTKLEQFDFYHAEFENMGLAPVGQRVFDGVISEESTHGFGPRYYEYKQNLDLAHDNFMSAPNFDHYENPGSGVLARPSNLYKDGSNSNYITTRPYSQDLSLLSDRNYIFPDAMDSVFTVKDDGTPNSAHFDVALQCNISAVLPMSATGMM